jgi:hypothetical protein
VRWRWTIAAITHPGLPGCASSRELLAKWNKREAELIASNPKSVPPLAIGVVLTSSDNGRSLWLRRSCRASTGLPRTGACLTRSQ